MSERLENGPNGESGESSAGGRDKSGRFTAGNRAAVGRRGSFEAQRAELRAAFMAECTPEDLRRLARTLLDNGIIGDVPAARVALAYCLGAPTQDITIHDDLDDAVRKAREEIAARVLP